jgi:DNA polymerase I
LHNLESNPTIKIESLQVFQHVLHEIRKVGIFAQGLQTTGSDPLCSSVRLALISLPNGRTYVADIFVIGDECLRDLAAIAEDGNVIKIIHDAKLDLAFIRASQGRRLKFENVFDTMLASQIAWSGYYNLAPSKSRKNPWKKRIPDNSLEALADRHLGIILDRSYQNCDWSAGNLAFEQIELASQRVRVLIPLYKILRKLIVKNNLDKIAELEFRTLSPVIEMQLCGLYLDADAARALISEKEAVLVEAFGDLQKESKRSGFYSGDNCGFYLNPDRQQDIKSCLQHLGFCVTSTKAVVLQELAAAGCIFAERLLCYRRTTHQLAYLYDWLEHIHPRDGRIHSIYSQMHAATGRLSCKKPNAQQVPSRGEDGLALRRLFKAPDGKKLVIADFSAIEMRIMAYLSGDETMIRAFQEGQDLHKLTASRISGQPLDEITKPQRDGAKAVNFLLIYGGSAQTLQWHAFADYGVVMSLEEANEAAEKYFEVYSGVKAWQEQQIREMSYTKSHYFHNCVQGFIEMPLTCTFTALGRRRVWPRFGEGIKASKFQVFNTPCQGTGADLMKMVMCELYNRISSEDVKIIASVHDEILLEVPENEAEAYAGMLSEIMDGIGSKLLHPVPVRSEVKILSSWGD